MLSPEFGQTLQASFRFQPVDSHMQRREVPSLITRLYSHRYLSSDVSEVSRLQLLDKIHTIHKYNSSNNTETA